MKALFLENSNAPLKFIDCEKPKPSLNEAVVKLKAAALNHRDWWIQKGQYGSLKFPMILGSDGAGTVTEIGNDVDPIWKGKEVIINPGMNWGSKPNAHSKEFEILGMPRNGTFAEYVKVPASSLYEKPRHLNFEQAAALPLAGLTGYRALFSRGIWNAEEKLLITGIGGGVALTILQFAISVGKNIYVTSGSEEKIKKAKDLGALNGVNYKIEGWEKEIQSLSGGGFDLIIDSAAGEGFSKLIELSNIGGKIVFYGGTRGPIKEIIPGKAFWKQLSILGTTMGNDSEFAAMIKFVNEKKIIPIIDKVFTLSEAAKGFERMNDAQQFGKIILKID